MTSKILILLAGLMGATGVTLAAAAAHVAQAASLDSAAYMLLFHAAALLGGTAFLDRAILWRPALLLALAGFVAGSVLFASDIGLRALAGHPLFPMAAPTGGTLLIAAWLVLAVAGIAAMPVKGPK